MGNRIRHIWDPVIPNVQHILSMRRETKDKRRAEWPIVVLLTEYNVVRLWRKSPFFPPLTHSASLLDEFLLLCFCGIYSLLYFLSADLNPELLHDGLQRFL